MIDNNLPPIEDPPYECYPKHTKINLKLEKYFPPGQSIKFPNPDKVKPHRRTYKEK